MKVEGDANVMTQCRLTATKQEIVDKMRYLESAVPNNYCENLAIDQNHSLNSRPRIGQYPNTGTCSLTFHFHAALYDSLNPSFYLSICFYIYICLFVCLYICPSLRPILILLSLPPSLSLPCLAVRPFVCVYVSVYMCVCLSACLSVCLSECLPVCNRTSGINLQNLFRYQTGNFLKKKILLIIS